MSEIEKYARAAASTARTPPNSPARHAAIEAENAARVAAEQFVKGLEAERDELRGGMLWVLWHHQGGYSPIGQPIRRALGMGQFDSMTPEQVEYGQRFGVGGVKPSR